MFTYTVLFYFVREREILDTRQINRIKKSLICVHKVLMEIRPKWPKEATFIFLRQRKINLREIEKTNSFGCSVSKEFKQSLDFG